MYAAMAQSVERVLGKDEVTSSNLVSSSETTVSDLLTVVFCYAATESFRGLGGGVQAKRNRAPMSYLPGVPENTEYFWGETGHQFKSG